MYLISYFTLFCGKCEQKIRTSARGSLEFRLQSREIEQEYVSLLIRSSPRIPLNTKDRTNARFHVTIGRVLHLGDCVWSRVHTDVGVTENRALTRDTSTLVDPTQVPSFFLSFSATVNLNETTRCAD